MLVLTRKISQSVTIYSADGPITVTVSNVSGGIVQLGFTAPKKVPIHRHEVAAAIEAARGPDWWKRPEGGAA